MEASNMFNFHTWACFKVGTSAPIVKLESWDVLDIFQGWTLGPWKYCGISDTCDVILDSGRLCVRFFARFQVLAFFCSISNPRGAERPLRRSLPCNIIGRKFLLVTFPSLILWQPMRTQHFPIFIFEFLLNRTPDK